MVAADGEDEIHELFGVELLAKCGPGRIRDLCLLDELVDRGEDRLVEFVRRFAPLERGDVVE